MEAPTAPANVTGDSQNMAMPPGIRKKDKHKVFDVKPEIFRRFETGKVKFERWSRYLNLDDVNEKAIYDYTSADRENVAVLRCSTSGALRKIFRRTPDGSTR